MSENKTIYQDDVSFIEYDPVGEFIAVSRGQAGKYQLCALIFNVPADSVTWGRLRRIATEQPVGVTMSRHW